MAYISTSLTGKWDIASLYGVKNISIHSTTDVIAGYKALPTN